MRRWAAGAAVAAAAVAATGAARPARAEEAGGPPWSVESKSELALAPGQVAATVVVLHGRGRHRVSASGLRLDLKTSGPGISVRQRRYLRADAGAEAAEGAERGEAVFSIPVRGEAVGSYDLEIRARFWVCTPRSCQPVDERRRIAVTVSEPTPVAVPVAVPAAPPAPAVEPTRAKAKPPSPSR